MIIESAAKLNLYLGILDRKPDGYHRICTVFERISLFDRITLTPNLKNKISIVSDYSGLPKGKGNLAYQAASLLRKELGVRRGVVIEIKKNIPVGAGLGGGSSNAAAVLIGLNKLWKLNLSQEKLLEYGRRLGSDVAFFLSDSQFAIGLGRGEIIRPLSGFKKSIWHIVVVPRSKVSTPEIYKAWDREFGVKKVTYSRIRQGRLIRQLAVSPDETLFNSLEEITFKRYPQVKNIKERLKRLGLRKVLMSGSGGAVFGIVNSRKEGLRIARFFRRSRDLRIFVVKTC